MVNYNCGNDGKNTMINKNLELGKPISVMPYDGLYFTYAELVKIDKIALKTGMKRGNPTKDELDTHYMTVRVRNGTDTIRIKRSHIKWVEQNNEECLLVEKNEKLRVV